MKNEPAIVRSDGAFASEPEMKAGDCFATKQKQPREKEEKSASGNRDPCGPPPTESEPRNPGREPDHQNENPRAREIQDQRRNQNRDAKRPKDPSSATPTKIILQTSKREDRRNPEKIARLVPIRERAKAAFVMPEG